MAPHTTGDLKDDESDSTDSTNFFTTDPATIALMKDMREGTSIDANNNILITERESVEEIPEWKRKHVPPLRYLVIGTTRTVPNPIGRNEPCSCGSGLKYKKCCLQTYWEEMA